MIYLHRNGLFRGLMFVAFLTFSSFADRSRQQAHVLVKEAFQDMANNWENFENLFATKASIKWCMEDNDVCKQGSFDSILKSVFQHKVRLILVEDSLLGGEFTSDMLHHFTYYIETPSGCSATWSGYAAYEFNNKGRVERMSIFSENSKAVLACMAQEGSDMSAMSS